MAFEIVFNPKSDDHAQGPSAHIAVDIELKSENGRRVLTPACVSPEEFQAMADMLIRELEQLKGRAAFLFNRQAEDRQQR